MQNLAMGIPICKTGYRLTPCLVRSKNVIELLNHWFLKIVSVQTCVCVCVCVCVCACVRVRACVSDPKAINN